MRQIPDTFIAELNKTIDAEIYGRNLTLTAEAAVNPLQLSYRYDYNAQKVTSLNGSFRSILGYQPHLNADIFGLYAELPVADEDMPMLNMMSQKAQLVFAEAQRKGELKGLHFSFEYRVKRTRGDYAWLLHQMTVVFSNFDGTPQLSSNTIADITTQKRDDKTCFVVSQLGTDQLYSTIEVITESAVANHTVLSERELEILELLRLGKSSNEISESLFISTHTVNTHRKNMLKKAGAKNTAELLFMLFAA